MADFRHVSKQLSQQNKSHKGSSRGKSLGGKVETRNVMSGSSSLAGLNKEQRYYAQNEQRKIKHEEMLMKRRGLNFVTEHHEELLEQTVIQACETQLDNVAPKIVALVGLGADCDTQQIRQALVEHCIQYAESLKKASQQRPYDEMMAEEDTSN
jgi:hypothetical protein